MDTFALGSLRGLCSSEDDSLGGNTDRGDPYTHAPSVWDYLVDRFAVRSVLDVGAGQGHAAAYFHRHHGCAVVAMDGLPANLPRAVYPLVLHDLRQGPFTTQVDLVHCAEVVEHIAADYVDHITATLACGQIVCLTHAQPGQDGYHHVNCQPPEYWIERLQPYGFILALDDTKRVRALGERDGAVWFARTGLVLMR